MKGVYSMILACERPFAARIGALGRGSLEKGLYVYTGSGVGDGSASIECRVRRHWRRSKRVRWHIDYLTHHHKCVPQFAVCLMTNRRLECEINKDVAMMLGGVPLIWRIGASDCRCEGHLLQISRTLSLEDVLLKIGEIYVRTGDRVGIFFWDGAMRLLIQSSVSRKRLGIF